MDNDVESVHFGNGIIQIGGNYNNINNRKTGRLYCLYTLNPIFHTRKLFPICLQFVLYYMNNIGMASDETISPSFTAVNYHFSIVERFYYIDVQMCVVLRNIVIII